MSEITEFTRHLGNYLPPPDVALVERAFEFSESAHRGQFRKSGEPLRVKPPLRQDAGYRQRMRNIGFARFSKLALMRVFGKGERALDQRDVRSWQVVAKMSGEFGNFRHMWRSPRKGLLR